MANIVYLGSTNKPKVMATSAILAPYGYQVISKEVSSLVSNQPLNDEETLTGAFNRANALPAGTIRIGLEAGVTVVKDQLFLINYGVLIDEEDQVYYAGGTRIVLPQSVKKLIYEEKDELKDAMKKIFNEEAINQKGGAIGFFTNDLVKRHEIFEHIIKLLWGQYQYRQQQKEV